MNRCDHTLKARDESGATTGSWVIRESENIRHVECGVCGKFYGRIPATRRSKKGAAQALLVEPRGGDSPDEGESQISVEAKRPVLTTRPHGSDPRCGHSDPDTKHDEDLREDRSSMASTARSMKSRALARGAQNKDSTNEEQA